MAHACASVDVESAEGLSRRVFVLLFEVDLPLGLRFVHEAVANLLLLQLVAKLFYRKNVILRLKDIEYIHVRALIIYCVLKII